MKQIGCIALLGLLILSTSCTVSNEITIQNDGSGSSFVEIALNRLSVRYMSDLIVSLGGSLDEDTVLFDVEAIRTAFTERQGVELVSIEPEGLDVLRLEIRFDDVRAILDSEATADHSGAAPVSFSRIGSTRKLSVHFSRENFAAITGLFILPDSPITVLIPYSEHDFLSRDEYLEVTEYAFEDYLEEQTMEEMLTTSGISVAIESPGTITDVQGGLHPDDASDRANFFIPLLDLLTLEEDLILSVSWR